MSIEALLLLTCLSLTGCASGKQGEAGPKQFPVSLRDLLLMVPEATLGQVEAAIGPPPRKGAIVEDRGLFETPDHYWIDYVVYYGEKRRGSIEIQVNATWLGPCFPIDELPGLIGAHEIPPPVHERRRTFVLNTEHLLATFRASYRGENCLEMIYLIRR